MGVEPIFNETRLVPSVKCCVCSRIEKKDNVLMVKQNSIENNSSKSRVLMVSGLWIKNMDMQKMKLFMINHQQQLSSNNLILVK
jgi:hypothetical protein